MIGTRIGGSGRIVGAMAAVAAVGALTACQPVKKTPPVRHDVVFGTVGAHDFVVPAGVTQLTVDAFGAAGGAGEGPVAGGLGGRATVTIAVTPGETLRINVGGVGTDGTTTAAGIGGSNGGANGGFNATGNAGGGGGGGASDVRRGVFDLADRLVVGGGGGGGGTVGQDGTDSDPDGTEGGFGGTEAAGGAGGSDGGADADPGQPGAPDTGGGGGGRFGGGGGAGDGDTVLDDAGGGGGSGLGPAGVAFETGARAGNGRVVLTY